MENSASHSGSPGRFAVRRHATGSRRFICASLTFSCASPGILRYTDHGLCSVAKAQFLKNWPARGCDFREMLIGLNLNVIRKLETCISIDLKGNLNLRTDLIKENTQGQKSLQGFIRFFKILMLMGYSEITNMHEYTFG